MAVVELEPAAVAVRSRPLHPVSQDVQCKHGVLPAEDTCLDQLSWEASSAGAVADNVLPEEHRAVVYCPLRPHPGAHRGRGVPGHDDGTHLALPVPLGGRTDRVEASALVVLAGDHDRSPEGSATDSHRLGCCHDHVDHLYSYLRGRDSFDNERYIPVISLGCLGIRHDVHRDDPLFYPYCVYHVFYHRTTWIDCVCDVLGKDFSNVASVTFHV